MHSVNVELLRLCPPMRFWLCSVWTHAVYRHTAQLLSWSNLVRWQWSQLVSIYYLRAIWPTIAVLCFVNCSLYCGFGSKNSRLSFEVGDSTACCVCCLPHAGLSVCYVKGVYLLCCDYLLRCAPCAPWLLILRVHGHCCLVIVVSV